MHATLVTITLLSLTAPAVAADKGADFWTAKARSIIVSHHLLRRSDLRCVGLVYGVESTPAIAGITAVEKHGGGCKGDPNTAPRMFTMEIDKTTGRAKWDRDTGDLVMKPVP